MTPRKYLTSAQVAKQFDVSIVTVTRWAKTGRLPATVTPGGAYRFRPADVKAALEKSAHESADVVAS